MAVIGGDLGAMASLSQRFSGAGASFQTQAAGIATSVDRALQAFVEQMRALDTEARALASEIDGEMTRLDGQAASTTWTGTNRDQMNAAVAALDDDIARIKAAIDTFVDEASSVVNGALTTTMTELRTNVEHSGARAGSVADGFSTSVANQRTAFDNVLNG